MLEYWFSNFCPCWNHLEGLFKCQSLSSRVRQEHLQFSWLIMWGLCCWSRDHILRTTALKHQSGHAGEGRLVEIQNLEPHLRSAESDIFVMMLSIVSENMDGVPFHLFSIYSRLPCPLGIFYSFPHMSFASFVYL